MGIDTRSQYNDVCFGYTLVPSQYHGIHIIGTHTRSTSLSRASNKLSPYIEMTHLRKQISCFDEGQAFLGVAADKTAWVKLQASQYCHPQVFLHMH